MIRLAYIAPELPALSATFVYEELLALERRGYLVLPISVHSPTAVAQGQADLAARCMKVYDVPKWYIAISGLFSVFVQPGLLRSLGWLMHDLRQAGVSGQGKKLVFQFLAGVKVAHALRRNRIAHLHIHFSHVPTQIGMYAAGMANIPFTVMAHANDIFERGFLLSEKAQRSKKFLTISDHNLNYLRKLGLPEAKLAIVRCGVSFQPPAVWPQPIQKSVSRIGTLGRLVEKKGVDVLLQALVGLPDVRLSIAGDGPLLAELQELAKKWGIAERVEFVGSLSHREVADWLAGLDAFVLACKQDSNGDMDGIPVVLMEAMSQGIPVISTRLSGIPELVIDGKTGLLASPADVLSLRACIEVMLASAELRSNLARFAEEHVRSEFGQEINIDRLLRHFHLPAS